MRKMRRLAAWALALSLLAGLLPAAVPSAAAETAETCSLILTGNSGAVVSCSFTPLSAEVDDNSLAIVELRGAEVRVIAKENAVGVARLTIEGSTGYQTFDIPIGYTTFIFDGGKLTVVEGSDGNYQVTGINAAAEEYTVGGTDFNLPEETDADGNHYYENTADYKLCVSIAKTGGTYVFTGTGADACIAVKKGAAAPAVLLLAGLELSSSFTAPITVKKESTSTVTVTALGGFANTLTDAAFNNADTYGSTEEGGDGTNAEYAESAVIKAKSYANLTLNGAGTLNLVCNSKNALKVGEYGALTINELTLNVTSVRNGVSSDNTLVVNGGTINVTTTGGDCIRSDPDVVNAEAGCAGCVTINGGVFTLQSSSDGIQAAQDLTVNGGEFHIRTGSGYNDNSFNKDTMSCKGLKASTNAVDTAAGEEEEEATNHITITGGTFDLNTADDAIHSDAYVSISGGEFTIRTGDDGVHGDTQADFGVQNAADCRIHLTVTNCYEGLEAKNVYIKSGCYSVTASDDGINAAGGSSNGPDPGGGGWDPWNPGGPGGNTGDYELIVSGGMVNVNAGGDGLDSNGKESLTGGSIIVWGAASNGQGSDNSPLDCDGTLLIKGATVFAAGSRQMATTPGSGSQPYVRFGSSGGGPGGGGGGSSISAGKTVIVKNNSSQTVFSIKAVKTINYALYSTPSMTSSSGWSISSDSSTPTAEKFWTDHLYGSYVQTQAPTCTTPGVKTAVCSVCGGTVTEEIAPTGHSFSLTETVAPAPTAEGYDVYTCSACGGTYRTNFTEPTGEPDPCIDGHTWDEGVVTTQPTCTEEGVKTFTCTVCGETTTQPVEALGHAFDNETGVCGRCGSEAFKAIFDCSEGVSVTVFPTQDLTSDGTEHAAVAFPRDSETGSIDVSGGGQVNFVVVPEEGYDIESVVVTPAENFKNLKLPAEIGTENAYRITKVTGDLTVTVTASTNVCSHEFDENGICIHCGYEAPKAVFNCSEGVSVTVFPTQDLTSDGTEHAAVAFPRDSETGSIDVSGGGQVNFVVVPEEGYDIESVVVTPAENFKNLKLPAEIGTENAYRITKVTGDLTVTVTASTNVCSHEFDENGVCIHCGYEAPKVTFACDEHSWITAYPTQDLTAGGTDHAAFALARDSATGEIDITGNGQVNYMLHVDEGWKLESMTAEPTANYKNLKDNGDGSYRLTKISGAVTLTVTTAAAADPTPTPDPDPWDACDGAELCPGRDFTDMPAFGNWAHKPIDWALVEGITTGTSTTTFSPKGVATRAQVVTFLWRAAGSPEPASSENPFRDIQAGKYYYDAVLWAVEQGIAKGTTDTTFSPNQVCTRGTFVTFLYRSVGSPSVEDVENPFTDTAEGKYYYEAVLWAVSNDITNGTSDTTFSPNGTCTRAQVVTFLYRCFVEAAPE